jgi:hypothetical protein
MPGTPDTRGNATSRMAARVSMRAAGIEPATFRSGEKSGSRRPSPTLDNTRLRARFSPSPPSLFEGGDKRPFCKSFAGADCTSPAH